MAYVGDVSLAARRGAVLIAALAALLLIAAPASADCPGAPRVSCRHVVVPLDRTGALPGTVDLRVGLIPGTSRTQPPVVALTGGPGQAGVQFSRDLAAALRPRRRDLVTLDQRGTGASGLLRCPAFERRLAAFPLAAAGDCGRALGPARALYRSADSAEDIEAVRQSLGAERIALYGVSYGTRVALEYARLHPDRVDRLVLDSPVGLDGPDPFGLDTLQAIPRVLRTACRAEACPGAGPHPIGDLRRLAAQLRRAPLHAWLGRDGRSARVRIGPDDLLATVVSGDLRPGLLQELPAAVRQALAGRAEPLARLTLESLALEGGADPVSSFSPAVYAASLCEESPVAWSREADPATRRAQARAALDRVPAADFGPFDRETALDGGQLPLCGDWPAPARAFAPPPALAAGQRALVLSGDLDLRTPTATARHVASSLGDGPVLVEHGVGHSVLGADPSGCAGPATRAFLAGREQPACATG